MAITFSKRTVWSYVCTLVFAQQIVHLDLFLIQEVIYYMADKYHAQPIVTLLDAERAGTS